MFLSQKCIRSILGILWLIDGVLQVQPRMFTMDMVNGVMVPMLQSQPAPIATNLHWIVNETILHLTAINLLIAIVQILLGLAFLLLPHRWIKTIVILSIVWALIVWYAGEGMSMLLTGQSSILTGAPGAVLLYPLLALVIFPHNPLAAASPNTAGKAGDEGLLSRRFLRWVLAGFWLFAALLQLQPAWWQPGRISQTIGSLVGMGGLNGALVDPILQGLSDLTIHSETPLNLALIGVFLALFLALAVVKQEQLRPALLASIVVSVAIWSFTQAYGGILSGMATDFNSGLLLIVLALACWPKVPVLRAARARFARDVEEMERRAQRVSNEEGVRKDEQRDGERLLPGDGEATQFSLRVQFPARSRHRMQQMSGWLQLEAFGGVALLLGMALLGAFGGTLTTGTAAPTSSQRKQTAGLFPQTQQASGYRVTLQVSPDTFGINTFTVKVQDDQQHAVTGAAVLIETTDLDMAMGTQTAHLQPIATTPGSYAGPSDLTMLGNWQVMVRLLLPNQNASLRATFTFSTQQQASSTTSVTPSVPANVTLQTAQMHVSPFSNHAGLMQPAVDAQGNLWVGEMDANRLARLDTRTGSISTWQPPHGQHGIMTTTIDAHGMVWFVEQAANYIGRFDPVTQTFRVFPLGTTNGRPWGPQNLQFDATGHLWFTALVAGRIGRLDPVTGTIQIWAVPAPNPHTLPSPYGLTITNDGQVWFADLIGGGIGRLDPATGQIKGYALPDPETQVFALAHDSQGRLWFTEIVSGTLGMLDPTTGQIKERAVPAIAGRSATLYGLAVTQRGDIWFADNSASALVRYAPATNQYTFLQLGQTGFSPYGLTLDAAGHLWLTAGGNAANAVGEFMP